MDHFWCFRNLFRMICSELWQRINFQSCCSSVSWILPVYPKMISFFLIASLLILPLTFFVLFRSGICYLLCNFLHVSGYLRPILLLLCNSLSDFLLLYFFSIGLSSHSIHTLTYFLPDCFPLSFLPRNRFDVFPVSWWYRSMGRLIINYVRRSRWSFTISLDVFLMNVFLGLTLASWNYPIRSTYRNSFPKIGSHLCLKLS